jgi:hypothetical protein
MGVNTTMKASPTQHPEHLQRRLPGHRDDSDEEDDVIITSNLVRDLCSYSYDYSAAAHPVTFAVAEPSTASQQRHRTTSQQQQRQDHNYRILLQGLAQS